MKVSNTLPGHVTESSPSKKNRTANRINDRFNSPSTNFSTKPKHVNLRRDSWQSVSEVQTQITQFQSAEESLLFLHRSLSRELERLDIPKSGYQSNNSTVEAAERLLRLEHQVGSQNSPLNKDLKPKALVPPSARQQSFQVNVLNLHEPKKSAERLTFTFPVTSFTAEVIIAAEAQGPEVAKTLDRALKREGIRVHYTEHGELEWVIHEAAQRKLAEPVLITGEGIRVPAGNPIPVQFTPTPGVLSQLAKQMQELGTMPNRSHLQSLVGQTEQFYREVKQKKQSLSDHVQVLRGAESELELGELQLQNRVLRDEMLTRDYQHIQLALRAQAHADREHVVALLNQER